MSAPIFAGITEEFSTGYAVMLLIHILSVVAAFGPALIYPTMLRNSPAAVVSVHQRITIPGLIVSGIVGNGLVGMSEKLYTHAQLWVTLSNTIWLVLVILAVLPMRKMFAKIASDPTPELAKKAMAFIGPYHLLFAVTVFLMIFKPGA